MKLNILSFILGVGFVITGIFAFASPEIFFGLLGKYYGAFNNHFVKDAGIAFFSAGCLILVPPEKSIALNLLTIPGGSQ